MTVQPSQPASRYEYSADLRREIERAIRNAIPLPRVTLSRSTLAEDVQGIDATYRINQQCPVQLRCRFDRPAYAADSDVTFRASEPRMIAAGTYAPLMLFLWLRNGRTVAGRLVDVYRMATRLEPPLHRRPYARNRRGTLTRWCIVTMAELHATGALLRLGDDDHWVAARLNGNTDTLRIIEG